MIKKIFKIIILIVALIVLFIFYLTYFGLETSKFNSIIKKQIKNQNSELDINLNKVKLHLDLKNISIKIKTQNPTLILANSNNIELEEISSNISIKSYFQDNFSIKNLSFNTRDNEIKDYINFYKLFNRTPKIILINQIIKSGTVKFRANLNFDKTGKISKDYILSGNVRNAEIRNLRKNIEKLNFEFKITDKNYNLKKINFNFSEILFNSDFLKIQKKNKLFFIEGDLKNKKNKLNNDLLKLFFLDKDLKKVDFSNSKVESKSKFSFQLNNKYKIKNLIINSDLNLDVLVLNYELDNIKNYINEYDKNIKFKENKFKIKYKSNYFEINGYSELYINEDSKNLLNFNITKNKNQTLFETILNLSNIGIKFNNISYNKSPDKDAILKVIGSKENNKIFFNKIIYNENKNIIELNNLEIDNNKVLNIDKIYLNYLTKNSYKNKLSLVKKDKNYKLTGKTFDAEDLIENILNSEENKNFLNIFENLNSEINIEVKKIRLDKFNEIQDLNGLLKVKNNKIFDLDLNSNFNKNEKLFLTIKSKKNNTTITNFYSDKAKPFVKKYKFIKGFEDGNIVFHSTKVKDVSKSRLVIDNFKVKEIPALAKLLTLASLQGIADLLTGEGIRFTDFEMNYSNKGNLMTIDEIYAIGPAISIMMEGYVERKKLISLRGTLVPATTINRTISSIPLLGDILIGKKTGEGVFGVSFKIKGPPKDLKTTVNPIKSFTPRFITRTLEKIKKN